ncbi:MAG: PilZ domain-containing protein [Candidatus Omnitrophica bacterium]|nr:PilZ domain-containing protein [Candidatus Omnitrophota bacterium]MBU1995833.1 PilZ domain-containing protein [Candidatus Omnitrophota bacterium]MBU4332920.1 PilZ domain-containing protein [Candidatus Omnitrophota bacterium]
MIEKRICRRLTIELPAHYCLTETAKKGKHITLVNISSGGLCFISETPIGTRKHIYLKIPLENQGTVTLKTLVVWYRKHQEIPQNYLNGVKILRQKNDDVQSFIRYCEKRLLYLPDEY